MSDSGWEAATLAVEERKEHGGARRGGCLGKLSCVQGRNSVAGARVRHRLRPLARARHWEMSLTN